MNQDINIDEDGAEMLAFLQEIKGLPDYHEVCSDNTWRNFDLYEKALSGDSEALFELSIFGGFY